MNSHDSDLVYDYFGASCYKVMSADPSDMLVNDLASLKSGVAMASVVPELSLN